MTRCTTLNLHGRRERSGRGRVEVTGGFLLLLAWLNYCDTQHLLPAALCAAAAHELGHLAAIRGAGGRVSCLRLTAAGAELRLEGTLGYSGELLCTLAGPMVNLVLAIAASRLDAVVFAGLNLALGSFNLLPLSALDGGKALGCGVAMLFGPQAAQNLLWWMDGALTALLMLCGIWVLWTGGNVTLLVVAAWLMCAFCPGRKNLTQKGLSRAG